MSTHTKKLVRVLAPLTLAALMIGISVVLLATMVGAEPKATAGVAAGAGTAAGDWNRLRVYGRCGEDAAFPYTVYTSPLSIQSWENPPKDFVVFNPAFLWHGDYPELKAGRDANEKVHLRMWYVPKYEEPRGETFPDPPAGKYKSPDIVMEYTYIMLDADTNNPIAGPAGLTQMKFPMAGLGGQIGLDRYDVNGDGEDEIMLVEEITPTTITKKATTGTIVVSTKEVVGPLAVPIGDSMEFFDYKVTVLDILPGNQVQIGISYIGNRTAHYIGPVTLDMVDGVGPDLSAALVQARYGPIFRYRDGATAFTNANAVTYPFWVTLEYVGSNYVTLKPHRILKAGETFFVDGAEYDVAAILVEPHSGTNKAELKYITIRNPIPKCGTDVAIDELTVIKKCVPAGDSLPVLPPFNHTHDMVDDINIPDCCQGDPNVCVCPDEQLPDNVIGEVDETTGACTAAGCDCGARAGSDGYGDESCLDMDYNTIAERIVEDVPALDQVIWLQEEKEPRFDTNLLEEKFTEVQHVDDESLGTANGIKKAFGPVAHANEDGTYFANCNVLYCDTTNIITDHADPGCDILVMAKDPDATTWYTQTIEEYSSKTGVITLTSPITDGWEVKVDYCYCSEDWEWKNIETLPWDFTDFELPELPDVTADDPDVADKWKTGDYILVSSFKTENDVRVKFVFDAQEDKVNNADVYVQDAAYNAQYHPDMPAACRNSASLRIYGRCTLQATFPYTDYRAPLSIQSDQNPDKDFVVFNPAFLDHWDTNAHEQFGEYFRHIKADENACEKVHLRTWYVPKRTEPKGATFPVPSPVVTTTDIVNEYTYILLDANSLNPTHGSTGTTQLVFPMAGLGGQIGLDRYDVNGDGTPEIMAFEGVITPTVQFSNTKTTTGTIIVSARETVPGGMNLAVGDSLQFFDYMVTLNDILPGDQVQVGIYYIGKGYNCPDPVDLSVAMAEGEAALVQARYGPVTVYTSTALARDHALPVEKPFWVSLEFVGNTYVTLRPYRILSAGYIPATGPLVGKVTGETFFVDGAEYDVAAILIEPGRELKYITLRNPLPKDVPDNPCEPWCGRDSVVIPDLTVGKVCIPACESLPMLPPFNYIHDMVDDINIPDCKQGDPNGTVYPDEQLPDNIGSGDDNLTTGCGTVDFLCNDYDTIAERIVRDVGAFDGDLLIAWIEEDKEERFDTNLLEEKFTQTVSVDSELWEWKNIETLPWDYTDLVLPKLPDITDPDAGYEADDGDYILVSSWTTENNVRVKFYHDAAFTPTVKTGIYVNTGTECPCIGDFNKDGVRDIQDLMILANHWNTTSLDTDYEARFDLDNDGDIDIADLMYYVTNFYGKPCD